MDRLINKTETLIKKIIQAWNIHDLKFETMDPVLKLMIACVADESVNLEEKIDETTSRIERLIIDSLLPYNFSYSKPAHSIIQASPSEAVFDVNDKQQFIYDKSLVINGKKEILQVVFSPVDECRLFQCETAYIFNGKSLYSPLEGTHFYPDQLSEDSQSLWIGLSMDDSIKSLENFSFYFSISRKSTAPEQILNPALIDGLKLFIGTQEVGLSKGIVVNYGSEKAYRRDDLYSFDLFSYYDLLRDSLCAYTDYLIKIKDNSHVPLPLIRKNIPDALQALFSPDIIEIMKTELLWLEFRFNTAGEDILDKVNLIPNAFPVINVKPITVILTHDESVRNIPLTLKEELAGILGYKSFDQFHNVVAVNKDVNKPFLLRDLDMEKFSAADTLALIENMIKRFDSDYHAFHEYFSLDHDKIERLREALFPVQESLNSSKEKQFDRNRCPYLIFKPKDHSEIESLEINCLITNGDFANDILPGEKLRSTNALVNQDSILFVSRSRGGRSKLSDEEKKKIIKYNLISNNQLITREDIVSYCHYELGDKVKSVSVQDSILNGPDCLRKCIKVDIVFDKSKIEEENLIFIIRELENKFRLQSALIVPIVVAVHSG